MKGQDIFSILEGSWSCVLKDGKLVETWIRLSDRTMQGRMVHARSEQIQTDHAAQNDGSENGESNGRRKFDHLVEEMLLAWMGPDLWYIVKVPDRNEPLPYRLVHQNLREWFFENPAVDFPQRIGYRILEDGTLSAWIEGNTDGANRRHDFHFSRE